MRLTHLRPGAPSPAHGGISDDGGMEWTFTGEVIEWRGPAPYLFVAMTAEESEDLKEAARGLIYWGQVPVHVTIGGTEFTTALFPRDGRYLVPVKVTVQRTEAIGEGAIVQVVLRLNAAPGMTSGWNCASPTTRSLRSKCSSNETPRTTQANRNTRVPGGVSRGSEDSAGGNRLGRRPPLPPDQPVDPRVRDLAVHDAVFPQRPFTHEAELLQHAGRCHVARIGLSLDAI